MYEHILVALDGSAPGQWGGRIALDLARKTKAVISVCHIYGANMHRQRFEDMEPGLPADFQEPTSLAELRQTHGTLMQEGFEALSAGFVEDYVRDARTAGLDARALLAEGRNYVRIIDLASQIGADLVVLGATGLGCDSGDALGSTTERVLRHAPCDMLIARGAAEGAVIAGIDGSQAALDAAGTAAQAAEALGERLDLAAVYDPEFHTTVFRAMGGALSPERQAQVGLATQEDLHDRIINDGLATLYAGFLDEAREQLNGAAGSVETVLLTGKAHTALSQHARTADAGLVVVGRYGHHREDISQLGANTENLARRAGTNVLIVGGVGVSATTDRDEPAITPIELDSESKLAWDADAEQCLTRVPPFARPMARRAIEASVQAEGRDSVTIADFAAVAKRFGMAQGDEQDQ
ncbi:MAG: universal stress protein [Phycisphaerae bacterium]|jgi:nucleotide-binding universal stress UspA family protein|nr:universal stress protein [Phycisphaerae bacterium]